MSIPEKIIREKDMLSEKERQKVLDKIKKNIWIKMLFC